jgi:hypothetical protein
MMHDRGRISLNHLPRPIGQFGCYLRVSPNDICPEPRTMETAIVSCSKAERSGGNL